MIQSLLCIGAGSCMGGIARYLLSQAIDSRFSGHFLPLGTLAVNVLGCFAIGLIGAAFGRMGCSSDGWRLFLTVGFCGGFTTFSTFVNESHSMLSAGQFAASAAYAAASLALGLMALYAAHSLVRHML